MRQLSLFEDEPSREERAPDPMVPEVGTQIELFADRSLLLAEARSRLSKLDPEGARRALRLALARYPLDERLREESAGLDALAFQVERALAAGPERRSAEMVAVASNIEPLGGAGARRMGGPSFPHRALWEALLERAATEAIARGGDGVLVLGHEPGWLFLMAGRLDLARASFARAVEATGRPRMVALLAESVRRLGDEVLARQLFFSALLTNPYEVDFSAIGDEAVRDLPNVARYQIEIDAEPVAWSAPVGVIIGVFHLPLWTAEGRPLATLDEGALSEPRRRVLRSAAHFLDALRSARSKTGAEGVIAARRTMKELQPALFERAMGRGTG